MIQYALHRVVQRYNHRAVLDIDRLEIEQGKIHALLGPNGAGKTTLLKLLAFLESPVAGQLHFAGQPVTTSPQHLLALRRRVVLVDQHPIMFSTTVRRNIEFGLKIRQIERHERHRLIDEVLATVGLSRYREAQAHELSGGETQRLALARALALSPEVLLCDEPTSSVDTENQAIVVDLLRRINVERSTTIVFTTHDRIQAATLAQRTLALENGRLADTSHENSYGCTLHQLPGGKLWCRLQGRIDLPLDRLPAGWTPTTSGRVVIDPEKIRLHRPGSPSSADTAPTCTGVATLAMADGENIRMAIDIGLPLMALISRVDYAHLKPAVGETVQVQFAPDAFAFRTAPPC